MHTDSASPAAAPRLVFTWTVPRAVSTAFERAFMQRSDTQVLHEPFTAPYYYGPTRRSARYASEPVQPEASYAEVLARLLAPPPRPEVSLRFVKDMAYCIEGTTQLDALRDATHTFLIRHPQRTIPSLHRMSVDTARTGWTYFDPEEIGHAALLRVFRWAQRRVPRPVVIDADRLLQDPEGTLRRYCEAIALPFEPGMLRWEPGEVAAWRAWKGWHEAAERSAGFVAREPTPLPEVTPELRPHVEAALPAYEAMLAHALW